MQFPHVPSSLKRAVMSSYSCSELVSYKKEGTFTLERRDVEDIILNEREEPSLHKSWVSDVSEHLGSEEKA